MGTYLRLVDYNSQQSKEVAFLSGNDRYITEEENYSKIPGAPIAYWISEKIVNIFDNGIPLDNISETRQGMIPGNTDAFLRLWFEVDASKIGFNHKKSEDIRIYSKKWFPYNKGGSFRRWAGNIEHLINMENDGYDIKYSGQNNNYRLREPNLYFQEAITWSKISSGNFSARYMQPGCLFDIAGCCVFFLGDSLNYILGFCNSSVSTKILSFMSPTLNFEVDHIKKLPIIQNEVKKKEVNKTTEDNIKLSKNDWDSFETSWDFKRHPLV